MFVVWPERKTRPDKYLFTCRHAPHSSDSTQKGRDAPTERDSINVPASSHQVTGNVHRLSLWGRTAKIE
ncbi:hypothetical protein H9L39_04675 [Fusarium oxysporum f. sp. albedinis]|nr:hypothetical protein H9L39_04675 [Fusarium oxysporum f. sp. albedinis]